MGDKGGPAELWGPAVAAGYDDAHDPMNDPVVVARSVDLLAELADGGPVVEFAIGTGRIGLPLSGRGLEVGGLDNSAAMLDVLRAKPGAERLTLVEGDMAEARVPGEFALAVIVYNSITNLLTQAGQVACFRNAARHLRPGGRLVIEVFVPQLQRLTPGERHVAFDVRPGHLGFDEYDVVEQRLVSHHVTVRDGIAETFESPHRYAWPAEFDLMAGIAGLSLEHRWSDWDRSPFEATSASHVSVYRMQDHPARSEAPT